MASKCVSWILVAAFILVLGMPAEAQKPDIGLQSGGKPIGGVTKGEVVGAIVAVVAVVVVVVFVAVHYSKKRTITGCVVSGTNGMTITDENDMRTYALSGNTEGVKPGDRVKLRGKKLLPRDPNQTLAWEAKSVAKDFGPCRP